MISFFFVVDFRWIISVRSCFQSWHSWVFKLIFSLVLRVWNSIKASKENILFEADHWYLKIRKYFYIENGLLIGRRCYQYRQVPIQLILFENCSCEFFLSGSEITVLSFSWLVYWPNCHFIPHILTVSGEEKAKNRTLIQVYSIYKH